VAEKVSDKGSVMALCLHAALELSPTINVLALEEADGRASEKATRVQVYHAKFCRLPMAHRGKHVTCNC
jgi:hypothetical protein